MASPCAVKTTRRIKIGKPGYSDIINLLSRYRHAPQPTPTGSLPGHRPRREREPGRPGPGDVAVGGQRVAAGLRAPVLGPALRADRQAVEVERVRTVDPAARRGGAGTRQRPGTRPGEPSRRG